jgi:hypothetical protein
MLLSLLIVFHIHNVIGIRTGNDLISHTANEYLTKT